MLVKHVRIVIARLCSLRRWQSLLAAKKDHRTSRSSSSAVTPGLKLRTRCPRRAPLRSLPLVPTTTPFGARAHTVIRDSSQLPHHRSDRKLRFFLGRFLVELFSTRFRRYYNYVSVVPMITRTLQTLVISSRWGGVKYPQNGLR